MTCLLDTHFVIWIVTRSRRLRNYPWLTHYQPWGVSPISLLEIQMLAEVGRLEINNPRFSREIMSDPRFEFDDVPFTTLIQRSLELSWTRDPFDRMIAAQSLCRVSPLCTVDAAMLKYHKLVIPELR
jgi:PIN domain nuclease of toxin-antitoxin system